MKFPFHKIAFDEIGKAPDNEPLALGQIIYKGSEKCILAVIELPIAFFLAILVQPSKNHSFP